METANQKKSNPDRTFKRPSQVNIPAKLLITLIRAYQATNCLRPACCRYYPSCSAYSARAIERHGAVKGFLLSGLRLLKCNPFNYGGVDEVPHELTWGKDLKTAARKVLLDWRPFNSEVHS